MYEHVKIKHNQQNQVGNIPVFGVTGAIEAYKLIHRYAFTHPTPEAIYCCVSADKDMLLLGFTPEECEKIEISVLTEH